MDNKIKANTLFKNIDDCKYAPKIDKKFLFWKWQTSGRHDYYIYGIKKFMVCSDEFMVWAICKHCESQSVLHFVEHVELINLGIKPEVLNNIGTSYYKPTIEDLR